MRGAISIIMAISLVSSPAIATDGEPDRIAALEARLAALHAEVSALKSKSAPKPQPPAMAAARSVAPAAVRLAGIAALGGIPPILAYPGYGGGGSTGGGAVTSANMPDPYVPVDGTMNVTGALNASQKFSTDATGVALQASAGAGNVAAIRSYPADGAAAIGWKIEVNTDLTTAGAKIASFGDNAGVSYAEKAYIDYTGAVVVPADIASGYCVGNSTNEACIGRNATDDGAQVTSATGGLFLDTASGSRGVRISNGQFQQRVAATTVADNGGGTAASFTLTITTLRGSHNEITCNDANGCDGTLAETAPLQGGTEISIVNLSANNVTFSDSAGVQLVSGATITLGRDDRVNFRYDSDGVWRQDTAVVAVE